MSNVLFTSLTALRAAQRALETTSHNIANVNTPGYSRQRVQLTARQPQEFVFGGIGNGVLVANVERAYDQFLAGAVSGNQSEVSRLEVFAGFANRLGALLDNPDSGLASSLQGFFAAAGDVANNPSSATAREAMLGEAQVIVDRFGQLASQIETIDREVNARLSQEVTAVDSLAAQIADANKQILSASGGDRMREPNDLLDHRDRLVAELSTKVGVSTLIQDDGAMNVFFGSGQPLVMGVDAASVQAIPDPRDPSRITVQAGIAGTLSDVTGSVSGGELGGLLDFSREGLDRTRNELGLIATAFASGVNAQHRAGMDLDGQLGGDFFVLAQPAVTAAGANTGSGTVGATIADVSAMTASDYRVAYDGAAYSVTRADTGEAVPFTGTGTGADPFVFEGLELVVGGAPAAGDQFLVRPTRDVAANLAIALDSARDIAAAFPVRTAADATNTGSGAIAAVGISDAANPALLTGAQISFLDANTYQIDGAGSFAYTPGAPIDINGAQIEITGSPQTGDTFTIESNVGGIGDNRNMLAISDVMRSSVLDGGTTSIDDAVGQLIARAGVVSREAGRGLEAQSTLLAESEARHLELSGVSLDEEAATMLQYQKAYEAAAQMIAVADSMFASLINAVRR